MKFSSIYQKNPKDVNSVVHVAFVNERGEPPAMNQLSLRNSRFKFKTSGRLPNILEESIDFPLFIRKIRKKSTCSRLVLESLGSQLIMPTHTLPHDRPLQAPHQWSPHSSIS